MPKAWAWETCVHGLVRVWSWFGNGFPCFRVGTDRYPGGPNALALGVFIALERESAIRPPEHRSGRAEDEHKNASCGRGAERVSRLILHNISPDAVPMPSRRPCAKVGVLIYLHDVLNVDLPQRG